MFIVLHYMFCSLIILRNWLGTTTDKLKRHILCGAISLLQQIISEWSREESDLLRSISELSARKIDVTNLEKIVWQALFDKRDEKSKSIYVMSSVVSPEGQVKLNSCNLAMHVITTCYGILTCQYISGVTSKCKSIHPKQLTWLNKTAILREQSCEMLAVSDASRIL